jgi:hypothetical protein
MSKSSIPDPQIGDVWQDRDPRLSPPRRVVIVDQSVEDFVCSPLGSRPGQRKTVTISRKTLRTRWRLTERSGKAVP